MDIKSSNLIKIELPKTKSHIIQQNKGIIFCSVYKGLKGIFRKDIEEANKLGDEICNMVKEELNNQGFFSIDELPGYGISKKDTETILKKTKAGEKDLVLIFAYNKRDSQKTKEFLDETLKQQL